MRQQASIMVVFQSFLGAIGRLQSFYFAAISLIMRFIFAANIVIAPCIYMASIPYDSARAYPNTFLSSAVLLLSYTAHCDRFL